MTAFRVTKYNPACRDENGRFLGSAWTSISDATNTIEGQIEYTSIEDAYVKVACAFYEKANSPRLRVVGLETHKHNVLLVPQPFISDSEVRLLRMATDEAANKDELEDIVRLALREIIWCKLELSSIFYIHFGYDFYVYIGGDGLEIPAGLPGSIYVETMESPYAQE